MSLDYSVLPASFGSESPDFEEFVRTHCGLELPPVPSHSSRRSTLEEFHAVLQELDADVDNRTGAITARDAAGQVEMGAFVDYTVDDDGTLTRLCLSKGPLPFLVRIVERLAHRCGPLVVISSALNSATLIVPGTDPKRAAESL